MFVPVRKDYDLLAPQISVFYGYPCRSKKKIEGDKRKYYQVTARFAYESVGFGNEQPVLYLEGLEERKSQEKMWSIWVMCTEKGTKISLRITRLLKYQGL